VEPYQGIFGERVKSLGLADHGQILVLIEQCGYLIVFLGAMLESAGVPVPGEETVLLLGGSPRGTPVRLALG